MEDWTHTILGQPAPEDDPDDPGGGGEPLPAANDNGEPLEEAA
jgi:hypothetical protein